MQFHMFLQSRLPNSHSTFKYKKKCQSKIAVLQV